jgi:hypothetical protein
MPTMSHLHSKLRSQNPEEGPDAPVKHQGTVQVMTHTGVKVPRNLWDVQHLYASTTGHHGKIIQEDSGEVPEEGHFHTSERLGLESALPPAGLQRINPANIGTMPTSMVLGRDLHLPCDLLFGAPPTRSSPWLTTWWTLWNGYMTPIIVPINIWRWPASR